MPWGSRIRLRWLLRHMDLGRGRVFLLRLWGKRRGMVEGLHSDGRTWDDWIVCRIVLYVARELAGLCQLDIGPHVGNVSRSQSAYRCVGTVMDVHDGYRSVQSPSRLDWRGNSLKVVCIRLFVKEQLFIWSIASLLFYD